MTENCLICGLPLTALEEDLRQSYHYDCNKCVYCKNDVSFDVVKNAIENERPIYHRTCYDEAMAEEFRKRPVTITQELLDYHNAKRLLWQPNMSMSAKGNMDMAAINLRNDPDIKRWLHEKTFDEIFLVMKMMESCAAELNILLTSAKQKDKIRTEIAERDRKLVSEAISYRKNEEHQKETKREKATPEGKAISALMKITGMSLEEARAEIKKNLRTVQ